MKKPLVFTFGLKIVVIVVLFKLIIVKCWPTKVYKNNQKTNGFSLRIENVIIKIIFIVIIFINIVVSIAMCGVVERFGSSRGVQRCTFASKLSKSNWDLPSNWKLADVYRCHCYHKDVTGGGWVLFIAKVINSGEAFCAFTLNYSKDTGVLIYNTFGWPICNHRMLLIGSSEGKKVSFAGDQCTGNAGAAGRFGPNMPSCKWLKRYTVVNFH